MTGWRGIPGRSVIALLLLSHGAFTAAVDVDESVLRDMQREIAALRERVARLEGELARAADTPSAAPAASPLKSERLPEAARFTVGGRLKFDVIGNSVSVGGPGGTNRGDLSLNPGSIPLSDAGEAKQLSFSAHGSRVWFKAIQPTPFGDTAAFVETDFFSSHAGDERVSNSYTPRLRHAYGEWRGWTAGQTYTTFMNAAAFPELNDDGLPAGTILVRQPLLRKRFRIGAHALDLAAESPETTASLPDGSRLSPDDDRMPDWVARYVADGAFGTLSFAAMARELRVDDAAGAGVDDSAVGYALSASGRLRIGYADDFRFALSGGNALGRYMTSNAFNAARIDASGDLRMTDSAGGFVALRHWWNARWRSNLAAGVAWQAGGNAAGAENAWLATVHANLLFSPLSSTTVGVEWIHAWRRRFDDRAGHLDRLQFTAVHTF